MEEINFKSEMFLKFKDAFNDFISKNDASEDIEKLDECFYAYEYCSNATLDWGRYAPSEKDLLCKVIGIPLIISNDENVKEYISEAKSNRFKAVLEVLQDTWSIESFEDLSRISEYFTRYAKSEKNKQYQKAKDLISVAYNKRFAKLVEENMNEEETSKAKMK
ncbi:hypothetical protein [Mycoplasma sp. Z244C]